MESVLKTLSEKMFLFSSGRVNFVSLILFVVFIGYVLPDQAVKAKTYSGEAGSPDGSFFYSSSDLYQMAEAYGDVGRAAHVLGVGDPQVARDGGSIIYVAAGCYLLGGMLILLRNRWLLVIGTFINFMVILFFFSMYQTHPEVIFSPGGLVSKLARILLEILLLFVLITNWNRSN